MKKAFASDNYSGVHPRIMEKLMEVNKGHVPAYGADEYTKEAEEELKKVFGDVEVEFVFNGTGANVLGLLSMRDQATSVICPENAHIFQDETGAPVKIAELQLLPVSSTDGKLDIEKAKKYLTFKSTIHKPNPKIISITQATENGTIYSLDEIKAISKFAKENGMYLHMDGARISNAAVALGCSLKEITGDLGVDVLSFGGTKNGLMFGEAIIFFDKKLAKNYKQIIKQNLQMNSKMRFMSAQFIPYVKENLWYENAKHANEMAAYFAKELRRIGIDLTNDVKGNTIFAILPKKIIPEMQEYSYFYVWDEEKGEVRLITSFDTQKEDIDGFIRTLVDKI
jgi:threonine aldolase